MPLAKAVKLELAGKSRKLGQPIPAGDVQAVRFEDVYDPTAEYEAWAAGPGAGAVAATEAAGTAEASAPAGLFGLSWVQLALLGVGAWFLFGRR